MTEAQLEFRAELNNKKIAQLTTKDIIKQGDYIEWSSGAWASIDVGSLYIGMCPEPGMSIVRLI